MTDYKIDWLKANGKRYLAWLALAIAFSIACWFLSQWQLSRLNEVKAANALVTKNYDSAPQKLQDLAQPESFDKSNQFKQVTLTGHYGKDFLLIRNRPQNGQPGFEQFAPFTTTEGNVVFIDRGWYPTGTKQDLPDATQQLFTDCTPITIVGHLKVAEPDSQKDYPVGQIGNASPLEAFDQLPKYNLSVGTPCGISTDLTYFNSIYVTLESENPPLTTANAPKAIQRPELSEGNHLSYAMQWVLFALMAFIALFYMIRQELLIKKEQTDKNFKRKTRKKIGQADEDYEDQLT
ncbi:MAG: SURF1 family protein [Micrococcales bacterium]